MFCYIIARREKRRKDLIKKAKLFSSEEVYIIMIR
jgi:hypothetical protein